MTKLHDSSEKNLARWIVSYGGDAPPDYEGSSSKSPPPGTVDYELEPYKKCLPSCDLYIGIDKSGSMRKDCAGNDPPILGRPSRWNQLGHAVSQLAPYATEADADGIEVFFVTLEPQLAKKCRTTHDVETELRRMRPSGKTPLGMTLWNQLKPYLDDLQEHIPQKKRAEEDIQKTLQALKQGWTSKLIDRLEFLRKELKKHSEATKPRNYIFITDGEAHDKDLLLYTILHAAQTLQDLDCATFACSTCKQTHRQLGIQFVQIGNDFEATQFLEELDTIEGRGKSNMPLPDIVDTTPAAPNGTLSPEALAKAILGGFTSDFDHRDEKDDSIRPRRSYATTLRRGFGHTCPLGTPGAGPGCWYLDEKAQVWKRNPACKRKSIGGMAGFLSALKL
ncbi:hypothetical protein C8R43DRAFT_1138438 [Mycena crocata]|nr:hypothetical protein C8R43DRAFT_1138438 [Mycena crocata]